MLSKIVKALVGSKNDRVIKRMRKQVEKINALEADLQSLSDADLQAKTAAYKKRYSDGETLDGLLAEAFATVREASRRVMEMRHFDVQMIGGMTLHDGRISEMRTGEGKTLMATLPAYLNALSGDAVHVVTVNDYLASRDAAWMAPLYEFLGLKVGVIHSMQHPDEKLEAYKADITYGTNNEFGFDFLRDNMAQRKEDKAQRGLGFAIVDEVDSILIDEARTPLVISGAAEDSSELYRKMNTLIPQLKEHTEGEPGHYVLDLKARSAELNEEGHQFVEELLIQNGLLQEGESLYSATNLNLLHHIHSALRAHTLFHNDVEYIVAEGQVVLIDEHTGRTMAGRRLSEGLHQAIEAKEGVQIQAESQTLASTTFQNYFRLYNKLSGMTGTADTEAVEFHQIYGLDVVVIPTNKEIQRKDLNDLVFLTMSEKYNAVIEDIKVLREQGAPILVGTASIESSEALSQAMKKGGIPHEVLNAKQHDREADIIAQAGRPGAVTVATNMAGRGTDIVLGGNWESEAKKLDNPSDEQIAEIRSEWQKRHDQVIEAGGLHIIGTERHESRRIDNQLRGRAGRQGDPGVSRFYLSLDDPLMRIFISDNVRGLMEKLGMGDGEAIEHNMVSRSVEKAQRKVEGRNFDIRKSLLEFDDVANDQRTVIYSQRDELLEGDDIRETTDSVRYDVISDMISQFVPPQSIAEQWDIPALEQHLEAEIGIKLPVHQWLEEDDRLHEEALRERIHEESDKVYGEKREAYGDDMLNVERQIMLQVLDTHWKEHLASMDHLRQGISLRAYAQKNPKQEYKRESFELFQSMLENIKHEFVKMLFRVQILSHEQVEELERQRLEALQRQQENMQMQHADASALGGAEETSGEGSDEEQKPFVREGVKVGRNDPCPCGSGKKYKQCHGKL
ncbi:MAG: preprotein translocase subunit SecA [Cellvibrionaceae bacterium]